MRDAPQVDKKQAKIAAVKAEVASSVSTLQALISSGWERELTQRLSDAYKAMFRRTQTIPP